MFSTIMDTDWPIFKQLDECSQRFQENAAPEIDMKSLENWFRTGLTYTSNAIEGNSLTRLETDVVINHGVAIGGKPIKDHIEAQNHAKAWDLVIERSRNQSPVNEQDIVDIHSQILKGIKSDEVGQYRKVHTYIGGSVGVLPMARDVPKLMHEFGAWLELQPFTPATAFQSHLKLVAIHPFVDGNGRTARLLANTILMQGDHLPVIVQPEDRYNYYQALECYSECGSTLEFANYMGNALVKTYDWVIDGVAPLRPTASITQLPTRRRSPR